MSEEIKDTVEEKTNNTKKVIAKAVSRDMVKDKVKKAATRQIPVWMIGVALAIVIALVAVMAITFRSKEPAKPEYVTYSVLENIVNVSELSTFEAVYNGVAQNNVGINTVYFESEGTAHEWLTWRRCLNEFISYLFK